MRRPRERRGGPQSNEAAQRAKRRPTEQRGGLPAETEMPAPHMQMMRRARPAGMAETRQNGCGAEPLARTHARDARRRWHSKTKLGSGASTPRCVPACTACRSATRAAAAGSSPERIKSATPCRSKLGSSGGRRTGGRGGPAPRIAIISRSRSSMPSGRPPSLPSSPPPLCCSMDARPPSSSSCSSGHAAANMQFGRLQQGGARKKAMAIAHLQVARPHPSNFLSPAV